MTELPHLDGLPKPQRFWAVLTIVVGLAMAVLNGAITNVALPTIAKDLHASASASVWVVNAFQVAVTISLLPLSSLGDIIGYRRVYTAGLAIFTMASLLCAVSGSLEMLTAARVLQGLGAAGIMSVNAALIRYAYPRALLGRGIGVTVLTVATMSAAGPTVAAAVLAVASWHWLFIINVPLGVVALVLAARTLPPTPVLGHGFDYLSAALSALTFGLLIASIDSVGHAQSLLVTGGIFAATGVAATLLVLRETSISHPMLALDLFKRPVFSLSIATSICSFSAQGCVFIALPFYFEDVLHRSQVETGLLMTPWPVTVGIMAPIAGRLVERYSAGVLGLIGLIILSLGLVLIAALPPQPSTIDIVWRMSVCGIGFGFFQSPNNRTLIESAPRERSGAAGGLMSTARLLGQSTGSALVALVFGLVGSHGGSVEGTTYAAIVGAGFAIVAAVLSGLRLAEFSRRT